ncbi:hypothetical protein ACI6QG_19585, partial [Roseococcus sp. DSY-14]
MPAAVPLIAVVAGGVASAAVGGGIIGAIVGAGAAFVVSTIGASVFPAKRPTAPSTISMRSGDDPTAPGAGRTQSFRQPITEHQIVFGRCKVGGPIVFIHSATDDDGRADGWFYAVVVLAAHRVRAIGDVWLGDSLATDPKFAGLVR